MSKNAAATPRRFLKLKRGRRPQSIGEVPFIDHWPLMLKNHVSNRKAKSSEAPCLKETLAFLTCLKDHNNSHELCSKEGEVVQKCYTNFLHERDEALKKKKSVTDFQPEKNVKDMDPSELNRFLSHFPHKLKQ